MVGLAILGLAVSGCGKSGGAAGDQKAGQVASAIPSGEAQSDPATIVSQFLDAVRTGNDEKALSLLTATARQKAIETNQRPHPRASDTAKFEVGEVTLVGDDIARVKGTWTDLDEFGQSQTDHAIWVCRREAEGWRVGGVAAVIEGFEEPLLLDFEKPDEMAKKQEWLHEEMNRRDKAQQGGSAEELGKNPEDPLRR
jgi:hypothetical protein